MQTVIKRKSDGQYVGTVCERMTFDQEIELNVIPNFGGTFEDYEPVEVEIQIQEPQEQPKSELQILRETVDMLVLAILEV